MTAAAGGSSFGAVDCDGECGGCGSAFGIDVLTHGGERGPHAAADGVVVEADDGHVLRHVQAAVLDRADDASGDGVGEAEDGGWSLAASEDRLSRGVADVVRVGMALAQHRGLDCCRAERIEPAEKSLPLCVCPCCLEGIGQDPELASIADGHDRDTSMSQVDDVLGGCSGAEPAPGWVPVAEDEQRRLFAAVAAQDRWVLDTAYGAWLDIVLPRVDLVVGLDYPRWFSLQRVFRRSVMRAVDEKPICNGNTESFRAMLSGDSIIRWHFRSFGRKRGRMRAWAAAAEGPAVLLFTRSKDLEVWIDTLGDRSANGTIAPRADEGTATR